MVCLKRVPSLGINEKAEQRPVILLYSTTLQRRPLYYSHMVSLSIPRELIRQVIGI